MALQSLLWEPALEEMNAYTAEIAGLQEQLTAKGAKLLELFSVNRELAYVLSQAKARNAAGTTVSVHLNSVAGSCERPSKHAKMAQPCEDSFITPSTAPFSAPLVDREGYRNRCETLPIANQCISGLAVEAKDLREKLAYC